MVKLIAEYPGVRWWGDVVTTAFTILAAFARKLHAAFSCKGCDYGGGGGGGGGGGVSGGDGGCHRGGGSWE